MHFLELDRVGRAELFERAAGQLGRAAHLLEKDFWVCWVLEQLFSGPDSDRLAFKGGTSLSKVYRAIARFSEDVDITVDKSTLGYPEEPINEPWSKTRRKNELAKVEVALETWLRDEMVPALSGAHGLAVSVSATDLKTILVHYPSVLEQVGPYVQPVVRLEFGARNPTEPAGYHRVLPDVDVEGLLPDITFPRPTIRVLAGVRTFWEKVTLLHKLAHMPLQKLQQKAAERMSRHYYDVACLRGHEVGKQALSDGMELLARVVEDKQRFYPVAWARFDIARPGSMKLLPSKELETELARDYEQMREMFFVDPPAWSSILEQLGDLEAHLNSL